MFLKIPLLPGASRLPIYSVPRCPLPPPRWNPVRCSSLPFLIPLFYRAEESLQPLFVVSPYLRMLLTSDPSLRPKHVALTIFFPTGFFSLRIAWFFRNLAFFCWIVLLRNCSPLSCSALFFWTPRSLGHRQSLSSYRIPFPLYVIIMSTPPPFNRVSLSDKDLATPDRVFFFSSAVSFASGWWRYSFLPWQN